MPHHRSFARRLLATVLLAQLGWTAASCSVPPMDFRPPLTAEANGVKFKVTRIHRRGEGLQVYTVVENTGDATLLYSPANFKLTAGDAECNGEMRWGFGFRQSQLVAKPGTVRTDRILFRFVPNVAEGALELGDVRHGSRDGDRTTLTIDAVALPGAR